jgi:hypothetical protein
MHNHVEPLDAFEERTRTLFQESVEGTAALAAATAKRQPWFLRARAWTPAAGVTAAAVLGAFLWLGSPLGEHAVTVPDGQSNLEDLDIVASTDEGSGDTMDMLQDDIEFYDWADKAASGSATQG